MTDPLNRDRLARLLRERGAVPPMPGEADRAVRREIRAAFAVKRRRRIGPQWFGAAAAIIVVAVAAWWLIAPSRAGFDLDGNGRVDIVDALTLQLQGERSRSDVDGNGVVNAADARALARRVVRLEESVG